ncbi:hypothetical protein [Trichocoleus sp. DQ-U1]
MLAVVFGKDSTMRLKLVICRQGKSCAVYFGKALKRDRIVSA